VGEWLAGNDSQERYPHLLSLLEAQGLLEHGPQSRIIWQPSPCLRRGIEVIEAGLRGPVGDGASSEWLALDLACGLGRDATFLALRGWRVVAIDYLEKQVQRVHQFAAHYQVAEQVTARQLDLEATAYPLPGLLSDSFQLINVARYLHRPLFPEIIRLLAPGGYVCYHTFMDGCQLTQIGRPRRPQFLLQAGELRQLFAEPHFECIIDEVFRLPDDRPTSLFVARKRVIAPSS
jgi:SAM-dependent methyltransferase